jgi:hypothetical protein
MNTVKTIAKVLVVVGSIVMLASPGLAAGQQKQSGSGKGTMDRTRTPGACKGIETNTDATMPQVFATRYGNGGGAGQGTMDRTRTRTQTPGQCKAFENVNDDSIA